MTKYVRLVEDAIEACSVSQLKRDNPNVGFPDRLPRELLENYGVFEVVDAARPHFDGWRQRVEEGPVVLSEGVYTQTWRVVDLPKDEVAAKARAMRDKTLAQTDHTQLPDAPGDRGAWATYRQALRDIPQQAGFPDTIDWPRPPEGYLATSD